MLSFLSSSHHLVSAMALDNLFGVDPPKLAVDMRKALLLTQYFSHHLEKIFFLLTAQENPFIGRERLHQAGSKTRKTCHLMNEIMNAVGLSGEASAILGGRSAHPVIAMAGGVSQFVHMSQYDRLSEIAGACMDLAKKIADQLTDTQISTSEPIKGQNSSFSFTGIAEYGFGIMQAMTLNDENVVLRDTQGKEKKRFKVSELFHEIGFHEESWSYKKFAYLNDQGRQIWNIGESEKLFFVGPAARVMGVSQDSPEAEKIRRYLFNESAEALTVDTAFSSLVVELVGTGEKMKELFKEENLTGPSLRTIPVRIGAEGCAALESPSGLISHKYHVNAKGIVEDVQILDTSAANHALLCEAARQVVSEALQTGASFEKLKTDAEITLMAF